MSPTTGSRRRTPRSFGLVLACVLACALAPTADACFTFVVGRDAAAGGHVLMAHNEDDGPPQVVHHLKVWRRTHAPGEIVLLDNGGRLEQVPTTWGYFWSEMPDMRFSDSFLNEWGVCIASNRCPSRENAGEVTDGGIGRLLRRLVAQRARRTLAAS